MKPDTIFFDKDGTLMDFDSFWISVSYGAVNDVLKKYKPKSGNSDITKILSLLGVENSKTDIDGILCKGTYAEIGEVVHGYLKEKGIDEDVNTVKSEVVAAYNNNMDKGCVLPTCENIREVLSEIKGKGINLCVVTTDNREITENCLKKLNIADLFQYVYTDDGVLAPKPNSASMNDYCTKTKISKEKIVMVGDTETDVRFAKNSGVSVICVGKAESLKRLEKDADAVIPDISHLLKAIEVM